MNIIKVSILVPICNVEKFLDKCLSSLVMQTLREIEIICINDGSKDSSLNIIKKYANIDDRIVIIDKVNTGYGDSMNCGLRQARGEYIGIVESDDFVDKDMFKNLYRVASANKVDIVKSNYFLYWESPEKKIFYNNLNIETITKDTTFCKEILLSTACSIWAAIYKREWLKQNDIYFLTTPGASYQDTSFKFKTTVLARSIVLIPEGYLYYRQDNANSSVKIATYDKAVLLHKEYEEMYRFIQRNNLNKYKLLFYTEVLSGCMWNYNRIMDIYKNQYFNAMTILLNKFDEFCYISNSIPKFLKFGGIYAILKGNKILFDSLFYINGKIRKIKQIME